MKKQIHFILGVGEVGSAIKKILERKVELFWYDTNTKIKSRLPVSKNQRIDVLHIVIPYSRSFIKTIDRYKKQYRPKLIVNHSTVEMGVTQKLGTNAVHSPILGQHNDLYRQIKVFRKAIGANNKTAQKLAKKYLTEYFKLEFYSSSKTTELAKLISLSRFALQIHFAKYCEKLCKKTGTKYEESYTMFSKLYNDGYKKLKQEQFIQPLLYPPSGKIGGSCVIPGVKKTQKILKDKSLQEILESNKEN